MAWIQISTDCAGMNMQVDFQVIVPQKRGPHSALYLLHGYKGDGTQWIRRTQIEFFVNDMNLAVVMPNGHNSWWRKLSNGMDYFGYVTDELASKSESWFDVGAGKYIGGWSMGGYGALLAGLTFPEKYSHVIGLGAAVCGKEHVAAAMPEVSEMIFGKESEHEQNGADLFALAQRAVKRGKPLPKIYLACGRQDMLFAENERFASHLEQLGYDVTFVPTDGAHDWVYCNDALKSALKWLPEGRA